MRYPRPALLRLSFTAALAGIVAESHAALSPTSPFIPPQTQVAAPPAPPPSLEFRGVMTEGTVSMFSVFDVNTKKSAAWLKLNEPGPGFTIRSYDANNEIITVEHQGRTLKLEMRSPKISAAAAMAMPVAPVASLAPTGAVQVVASGQPIGTVNVAGQSLPIVGGQPVSIQGSPAVNPSLAAQSAAAQVSALQASQAQAQAQAQAAANALLQARSTQRLADVVPPAPQAAQATAAEAARMKEWTDEIQKRRDARAPTTNSATPATGNAPTPATGAKRLN